MSDESIRLNVIKFRVDADDMHAIRQALAIRGSGLFVRDSGELAIHGGSSDSDGKLIAAICREYVGMVRAEMIRKAVDG